MGMALHHQTWGKGFNLWDTWSSKDPRAGSYKPEGMMRKWESFADPANRKAMTIRSILNIKLTPSARVECILYAKLIEQCDDAAQLEKLRRYISSEIDMHPKELAGPLAKAYRKKKEEFTGLNMSVADATTELDKGEVSLEESEFFYERYILMQHNDKYFELSSFVKIYPLHFAKNQRSKLSE